MNLKQIEKETYRFPFKSTTKDSHFKIRSPLMQMFGLQPKKSQKEGKGWQSNGYTSKHMIPTNTQEPILRLNEGVDIAIVRNGSEGLRLEELPKNHMYEKGDHGR